MILPRIAFAAALALVSATALAQDKPAAPPSKKLPDGAIAVVNGQPISRADYQARLLHKHAGSEEIEGVVSQLTDNHVILQEMKRRKIEVADADVDKRVRTLDEQVKSQSQGNATLESEMERTGVAIADLKAQLRYLVALEAMARADFGIAADQPVPPDKMQLWLAEKRGKAVVKRDSLPAGVVFTVNAEPVYEDEVARELEKRVGKSECRSIINELVGIRLVQARMREQSIAVAPADLDAELELRKRQFAKNPRFAGVDFAQFIQATRQQTPEQMKADDEFAAQVGLKKLVARLNDDAALKKQFEESKDLYGPLMRARHILIKAAETGPDGGKPARSYDDARAQIDKIEAELKAGGDFQALAKKYSEDSTRDQGGDLGMFPPKGVLDESLAGAAAKLAVGEVSPPVRTAAGWHLVQLAERGPEPTFAEARDEVITNLARKLYKEIVTKAEITIES
jgi:parvulin-like peptidyl-prolyl isomerase